MTFSHQRAATLLELLTLILLLTIIGVYAVPSFNRWIEINRQQSLQDKLFHHLQSARSRAVLQGQTIEVCASSDGMQCDNAWHKGWILRLPDTEEVLAVEKSEQPNATLHWNGYKDRLLFRRNGQTPSSNGRFYLCHENNVMWQLVISRSGRVRHTSTAENMAEAYRCG